MHGGPVTDHQTSLPLGEHIRHLEDQARLTLDILEMATELSDFQALTNRKATPEQILSETHARLSDLIPFATTCFMLVVEGTSDFMPALCIPESQQAFIDDEVRHLTESGLFALAIRENRPITIYSRNGTHRLVLCVLATTARVRGMFIGVHPRDARNVSAVLLSLLRLVLRQCANAIEVHELDAMRRSDDRQINALFNGLTIPVFETDAAGGFRHMNPATRMIVARAALKGDAGLLDIVHPDDRPRLAERVGLAMQHSHPVTLSCRLVVDCNGSTDVLLHLTPVMATTRCVGLRGVAIPASDLA